MFVLAQALLGIPQGTIRATVLIETLPAAFEMEEILYELRDHSSGLNAGRWDYIFSYIKTFASSAGRVRAAGPLADHHDDAVHAVLHRTAGVHLPPPGRARDRRDGRVRAEQGRAGRSPAGRWPRCRADKEREAADGFDGSWVAHPGLVPTCATAFDAGAGRPAEPAATGSGPEVHVTADDLLTVRGVPRSSRWTACGPTSRWRCGTCPLGRRRRTPSRSTT